MDKQEHVVVIGAGIVGLSTAIWLRRAGCNCARQGRAGHGHLLWQQASLRPVVLRPLHRPGWGAKAPSC